MCYALMCYVLLINYGTLFLLLKSKILDEQS